ncbi:ORF6C domain-containing protein [Gilliamella sp. B2840]|uniref:BRO-N domain-containing protein n=3 Tax=unclassified Gilliamella TaxID=2685620 RepID=UPI00226A355F|nr:BRO family protein [Gilliamella sp. B2840]MCX8701635.1 ORF6C domain-containing protein [Gilliamella sp. B2840]
MTNQLMFHSTTVQSVNHNNQIWITSTELSKLLKYSDSKSVTKIYSRNSDEFTNKMTMVVKLTTNGINNSLREKSVRIFSLRGAHLVAMFANTEIAKEVRKWLLDLADKEIGISETISLEQQQAIQQAVNERVYRTGERHQAVYSKFHQQFKIPRYQDLPASKFDEAIKWLGGITLRDYKSVNIDNLKRQYNYIGTIQEYYYRIFDLYNDCLADFLEKNSPHLHYNFSTALNKIQVNLSLSMNFVRGELPRMNC